MNESKIKKYKMAYWLPVLVFCVGAIISACLIVARNADESKRMEEKAKLNAVTYSDRMSDEINRGIFITQTIEQIVICQNGGTPVTDENGESTYEIKSFDTIAKNIITDYVSCIQIAPKGKVTTIFPAEGNEAGKIDLLNDTGTRGEFARYAKEHNVITMQGPFELNQGGTGIAIRNPVYIPSSEDPAKEEFWGFTIVMIKVPKVFEDSIEALSGFNYNFNLSKSSPHITDNRIDVVYSSSEKPINPISHTFELGSSVWTLDVAPKNGWSTTSSTVLMAIAFFIIILLFSLLVLAILILAQKHHLYKNLATTDVLTGLYNRAGFESELKKYTETHKGESFVEVVIDMDEFKIINDLYGHDVGDSTLKHFANELSQAFPTNSIIARSGGDEFNLILKNTTCDDVADELKRFTLAKRSFWYNGEEREYSVSLGYAEYPLQAQNRTELTSKSDAALYQAKLRGKHYYCRYDEKFKPEERTKLGFALNDVAQNLPGAFLIYKADPADDTMLFANDEMVRLAGCESLDDFMNFCGRSFKNLIRPDEREAVEKSIWEQIRSGSDGSNDYVQFNFATKSGEYKPVLDHGRIVDSTNYGMVFYVLIIDAGFIDSHYSS